MGALTIYIYIHIHEKHVYIYIYIYLYIHTLCTYLELAPKRFSFLNAKGPIVDRSFLLSEMACTLQSAFVNDQYMQRSQDIPITAETNKNPYPFDLPPPTQNASQHQDHCIFSREFGIPIILCCHVHPGWGSSDWRIPI